MQELEWGSSSNLKFYKLKFLIYILENANFQVLGQYYFFLQNQIFQTFPAILTRNIPNNFI